MNEEKTRLQQIKGQLEAKMTRAIVAAIEDGAEYEKSVGGLYIDGVFITPKFTRKCHGLVLDIDAPEIEQLLEPSKEELKKRAEELRAQLDEIENKLKPDEQ